MSYIPERFQVWGVSSYYEFHPRTNFLLRKRLETQTCVTPYIFLAYEVVWFQVYWYKCYIPHKWLLRFRFLNILFVFFVFHVHGNIKENLQFALYHLWMCHGSVRLLEWVVFNAFPVPWGSVTVLWFGRSVTCGFPNSFVLGRVNHFGFSAIKLRFCDSEKVRMSFRGSKRGWNYGLNKLENGLCKCNLSSTTTNWPV